MGGRKAPSVRVAEPGRHSRAFSLTKPAGDEKWLRWTMAPMGDDRTVQHTLEIIDVTGAVLETLSNNTRCRDAEDAFWGRSEETAGH